MLPHKIGYNHTDRSTYSCNTVHQNLSESLIYIGIVDMLGDEVNCSVEIDRNVKGLMVDGRNVHVMIDDMLLMVELIPLSAAENSFDVQSWIN